MTRPASKYMVPSQPAFLHCTSLFLQSLRIKDVKLQFLTSYPRSYYYCAQVIVSRDII